MVYGLLWIFGAPCGDSIAREVHFSHASLSATVNSENIKHDGVVGCTTSHEMHARMKLSPVYSRNVHETFSAETETETRLETEPLQVAETFGEKQ